jgi:hypothetical protein
MIILSDVADDMKRDYHMSMTLLHRVMGCVARKIMAREISLAFRIQSFEMFKKSLSMGTDLVIHNVHVPSC